MSITYTCDWCGEGVDPDEWVELRTTRAKRSSERDRSGFVGQYHEDCWDSVRSALNAAHDLGQELESMPGTSPSRYEQVWAVRLWANDDKPWVNPDLDGKGIELARRKYELWNAGIRTVGDLRRAVLDGTLLKISGVGPRTVEAIRYGLETYAKHENVPFDESQDDEAREAVSA